MRLKRIMFPVPSISHIREKVREFKHAQPEIQRPLNFKNVHTISKASKPLQKYIEQIDTNDTKRDDIVIGGSGAAYAQVRNIRKPNDLDLSTSTVKKHVKRIVQILKGKYKNVGVNPSFTTPDGVTVTQITVKGEPVVDIKTHIHTGTQILIVPEFKFATQEPVKIDKMYYVPVPELLARKGKAIYEAYYLNMQKGKEIPKRVGKDVSDFEAILNSLNKRGKRR